MTNSGKLFSILLMFLVLFTLGISWEDELASLEAKKTMLIREMESEFGIVFPFPENKIHGVDYPVYEGLSKALGKYKALGITDFSNKYSGPLHFYVNSDSKTLEGDQRFRPTDSYTWNSNWNQIVYYFPSTEEVQNDRSLFFRYGASVYVERACIHELAHVLQSRNVEGDNDYFPNLALFEPEVRSLEEVGYRLDSPEEDIYTVPAWELCYSYVGADKLPTSYIFDSGSPFLEGYAETLTLMVMNPTFLKNNHPAHFAWAKKTMTILESELLK